MSHEQLTATSATVGNVTLTGFATMEDDELVFDDTPRVATCGDNSDPLKTHRIESASDDASLHFSEVDSNAEEPVEPSVWGPTGTPLSAHEASGLFAISDISIDRPSLSKSGLAPAHQLGSSGNNLRPPFPSSKISPTDKSSSIRRSPRTATKGYDDGSMSERGTNTTSSSEGHHYVFPQQQQHHHPLFMHNPCTPPRMTPVHKVPMSSPNSNGGVPTVNIYHLQALHQQQQLQQQQQHHLHHHFQHFDPTQQQVSAPTYYAPTSSYVSTGFPTPNSLTPGISTPPSSSHLPHFADTSINGLSLHANAHSTNSLSQYKSDFVGFTPTADVDRRQSSSSRGFDSRRDSGRATPPGLTGYPALYNQAANSFLSHSQKRPSSTRAEWSFSRRSDGGTANSPAVERNSISGVALHGSADFGVGSGVVSYGAPLYHGASPANDTPNPLPQFGAVMPHMYSQAQSPNDDSFNSSSGKQHQQYHHQPFFVQAPSPLVPDNMTCAPSNTSVSHATTSPSSRSERPCPPPTVDNWATMSTPSNSHSLLHNSTSPLPMSPPPAPPAQELNAAAPAAETKVCRHYLEGKCNRRKCRFLHPEGLAGSEA